MRKLSADLGFVLEESDSANPVARIGTNCYAEFAKRRDCFWHQALAASFVNRRLPAIRNDDGHSSLPRGNGSSQPRGPSPDYKHIHLCFAGDHS